MFDIDGTLLESYKVDSICFKSAVEEVTGVPIQSNWAEYQHVTDAGIIREYLDKNNIKDKNIIKTKIKEKFICKLQEAIKHTPIKEIPGANNFLKILKIKKNVTISFATRGWLESSLLKLKSAGIQTQNIYIASVLSHKIVNKTR